MLKNNPLKKKPDIHHHFKLVTVFLFATIIAPIFLFLITIKINPPDQTANSAEQPATELINQEQILTLTNKVRLNTGLNALVVNASLEQAAAAKAADIFAKQYFAHTSPENKKFSEWLEEAGYQYIYAGENLAADFNTPEGIVNAWMISPTHRKNLLNSRYWETGITVTRGVLNHKETTIVVQLFGVTKDSPQNPNVKTSTQNIYETFVLPYLSEYSLTPTGANDFEVAKVN